MTCAFRLSSYFGRFGHQTSTPVGTAAAPKTPPPPTPTHTLAAAGPAPGHPVVAAAAAAPSRRARAPAYAVHTFSGVGGLCVHSQRAHHHCEGAGCGFGRHATTRSQAPVADWYVWSTSESDYIDNSGGLQIYSSTGRRGAAPACHCIERFRRVS